RVILVVARHHALTGEHVVDLGRLMAMVSHPPTDLELRDPRGEVGPGGGASEDVAHPHFASAGSDQRSGSTSATEITCASLMVERYPLALAPFDLSRRR